MTLEQSAVGDGRSERACLTPECRRVQGELIHLAAALDAAALTEYAAIVPSLLRALREFRGHLREHVSAVQGPAGLFEYVETEAPQLAVDVDRLRAEHGELDRCMGELERQLETFDAEDRAAADQIKQRARRLGELTCCHQRSACP